MDEALRQAILGAGNIQAPASSLGASQAPELAQLNAVNFQLPQSNSAAGALAGEAQKAEEARRAAAAAAKKREADLADIKSYKIVKKEDGGYDFFDPSGQQVDIATLAQRTGVKARDIIGDSENPIDIQYREDYDNLQDYVAAVTSGDKKKVQAYWASKPELQQYNDRGGMDRLIQQFKSAYQRYYVPRSQDPSAWGRQPGSAVVPRLQTGTSYGLGGADEGV